MNFCLHKYCKTTLLLLFFLFNKNADAQAPWVPVNATWYYQFGVMGPQIYFNKWVCTKDTIMLGKNCSYIEKVYGNYVTGDFFNFNIMYEDSNIVYWYNAFQNSFSVLYNFNAQPGDSWTTSGDSCEFVVNVDSVSYQVINGDTLKVLFISSDPNVEWNGKVIENIGNIWRPTPNFMTYCYGWIEDLHYYTGLRCYDDDTLGLYETGIAPSCDTIINAVPEYFFNDGISVYPNPSTQLLNISFSESDKKNSIYFIQNSVGKTEQQGILTENFIDVKNLSPGVYFLKVVSERKTFVKYFIKI